MLRETLFLEGKEELVCFPYFVPRELHGHRVVALRPGEFFQDTVEVLAGNVHFPGPFVLFPEVPEEAVVDRGKGRYRIWQRSLKLHPFPNCYLHCYPSLAPKRAFRLTFEVLSKL